MAICSEFFQWKWWFSVAMLVITRGYINKWPKYTSLLGSRLLLTFLVLKTNTVTSWIYQQKLSWLGSSPCSSCTHACLKMRVYIHNILIPRKFCNSTNNIHQHQPSNSYNIHIAFINSHSHSPTININIQQPFKFHICAMWYDMIWYDMVGYGMIW